MAASQAREMVDWDGLMVGIFCLTRGCICPVYTWSG